jgi:hypothetical protein
MAEIEWRKEKKREKAANINFRIFARDKKVRQKYGRRRRLLELAEAGETIGNRIDGGRGDCCGRHLHVSVQAVGTCFTPEENGWKQKRDGEICIYGRA